MIRFRICLALVLIPGFVPLLPGFVLAEGPVVLLCEAAPPRDSAAFSAYLESARRAGVQGVMLHSASPAQREAIHRAGLRAYLLFPVFYDVKARRDRPELRPLTAEGRTPAADGWYRGGLCPGNEAFRRQRLQQAERAVREGCWDGVWLDFIRYPARWEKPRPRIEATCFCPVCLATFEKYSGLRLPAESTANWILARHAREWREFKAHQITRWVNAWRARMREAAPAASTGVFLVPWTGPGPREYFPGLDLGQDPAALGRACDYLSPMTYHGLCGQPAEWIADTVQSLAGQGRTLPVVQTMGLTDQEFRSAVAAGLRAPAAGVILFSNNSFGPGRKKAVREALAYP